MARRPLTFTKEAREDLLGLWAYIEENRSEAVADRVLARIVEACDVLREHPELGRSRPDIAPDARALVVERWLVLYRTGSHGVDIVRVVDGARDLARIGFPE